MYFMPTELVSYIGRETLGPILTIERIDLLIDTTSTTTPRTEVHSIKSENKILHYPKLEHQVNCLATDTSLRSMKPTLIEM